jgi:hypothetical protein
MIMIPGLGIFHGDLDFFDLHEKSLDLSNYEIFPHKILKFRTFKKSSILIVSILQLKKEQVGTLQWNVYSCFTTNTKQEWISSCRRRIYWKIRIHDILMRIRIRGSMPLTNWSGCGSRSRSWIRIRLFSSLTQDAYKKLIERKKILLITFWRYIYIIFQK